VKIASNGVGCAIAIVIAIVIAVVIAVEEERMSLSMCAIVWCRNIGRCSHSSRLGMLILYTI
jgi:hypothetical protein